MFNIFSSLQVSSTEEGLESKSHDRKRFVEATKKRLGIKARGKKVLGE